MIPVLHLEDSENSNNSFSERLPQNKYIFPIRLTRLRCPATEHDMSGAFFLRTRRSRTGAPYLAVRHTDPPPATPHTREECRLRGRSTEIIRGCLRSRRGVLRTQYVAGLLRSLHPTSSHCSSPFSAHCAEKSPWVFVRGGHEYMAVPALRLGGSEISNNSFTERLWQCMLTIAGMRFSNGGKPSSNKKQFPVFPEIVSGSAGTATGLRGEGPLRNGSCGVPSHLKPMTSTPQSLPQSCASASACRNVAPGHTRLRGCWGGATSPPA